ncbi:MAG: ABC transporter ATP-binding protein [Eubacteriales bacterium]|nr:ABC transporter ATP-binding protein [Clostridiales bacterium]MDD2441644.1 ABC transporter ATP-binding protein [Eubacteriales bacterium]MDD4139046.1 ABC transporter ATP-binding protein [Eubacteriales bacterium]MDD4744591.1 ABC transporter ATP-binding protein [Eubacteriales bacterium]
MIVKVEQLVKRYGDLVALDHFNLAVQSGEVFGLLGPNGSGKTTAINCMLALLKYSMGTVELFGRPMRPDAYDIKRDIGIVMQNVAVFDELTVRENIDYFCGLYVTDRHQRQALVDEAIAFVGLEDFSRFLPKKLSGGLLRRLNIACGIAHKPKLIFLDEPTVAVDPQSRNNILEGILELNRQGATVIYTSHYMEEVEQICSRIAIMDRGKVIASGTSDELKRMIRTGEKITVELIHPQADLVDSLLGLPSILTAEIKDNRLVIKAERKGNALGMILEYLNTHKIAYGQLYCELPTLNDVFLEITGKQLRDNGN